MIQFPMKIVLSLSTVNSQLKKCGVATFVHMRSWDYEINNFITLLTNKE